MKKSKLNVTKEDAFGVGRLEGSKAAYADVLEFLRDHEKGSIDILSDLKYMISFRLRMLNTTNIKTSLKDLK